MKKPRVNDFDPKTVPTLKSSLDNMPLIQPSSHRPILEVSDVKNKKPSPDEKRPLEGTSEPTPERSPVRTPERIKRTLTRYSFEFFQDQIERLKKFSIEEQIRGEKGNMSRMVREAIDTYIAKRMRTDE